MKTIWPTTWFRCIAAYAAVFLLASTAVVANAVKPITILIVGDSLSTGYGLSPGEGWVDLLTKKLATEKIAANVVNASISGDTTAGGLSRLPSALAKHKPTHVVIELGGNDGLRGAPVSGARGAKSNLQKMTDLSKAAGAKVIIIGMRMPPNFGASYTAQFESMYTDVAKDTKSALVPFFLEKLGTELTYFQADRIHPTAAAQPLLFETVWPTLSKALR
jgi:acyl-CoA thioesterase I